MIHALILQYVLDIIQAGVGKNHDNRIPHLQNILSAGDNYLTAAVNATNQYIFANL